MRKKKSNNVQLIPLIHIEMYNRLGFNEKSNIESKE